MYVKERIIVTRWFRSNDFNKSPPFLTSAIKLCIIHCTLILTEWLSAEILISTHLMLFHSMKQSLIISSTCYFQVYSLKKTPQKLRIFTYPLSFNYFYDSKHVWDMVALKLPEREFKSMLNFVRERIKHVYSVQL